MSLATLTHSSKREKLNGTQHFVDLLHSRLTIFGLLDKVRVYTALGHQTQSFRKTPSSRRIGYSKCFAQKCAIGIINS